MGCVCGVKLYDSFGFVVKAMCGDIFWVMASNVDLKIRVVFLGQGTFSAGRRKGRCQAMGRDCSPPFGSVLGGGRGVLPFWVSYFWGMVIGPFHGG